MFEVRKFGAYISKLRKDCDMTQNELSDLLNVTRQTVSKWERGESFPDISILAHIAKVFHISLEDLFQAGEASDLEYKLLKNIATSTDIPKDIFENQNIVEEIKNVAPLLKVSTLSNIAEELSKYHIDISHVIELAEFMNDESLQKLINNSNMATLNTQLLEQFMPFLDKASKESIFELILEGKLDYKLIKVMQPYMDTGFYSLVEAAVVEGALDQELLKL